MGPTAVVPPEVDGIVLEPDPDSIDDLFYSEHPIRLVRKIPLENMSDGM